MNTESPWTMPANLLLHCTHGKEVCRKTRSLRAPPHAVCAEKNTELHTNEDLPTFAGKSAVGAARNLQYRALRRRAGQCAV